MAINPSQLGTLLERLKARTNALRLDPPAATNARENLNTALIGRKDLLGRSIVEPETQGAEKDIFGNWISEPSVESEVIKKRLASILGTQPKTNEVAAETTKGMSASGEHRGTSDTRTPISADAWKSAYEMAGDTPESRNAAQDIAIAREHARNTSPYEGIGKTDLSAWGPTLDAWHKRRNTPGNLTQVLKPVSRLSPEAEKLKNLLGVANVSQDLAGSTARSALGMMLNKEGTVDAAKFMADLKASLGQKVDTGVIPKDPTKEDKTSSQEVGMLKFFEPKAKGYRESLHAAGSALAMLNSGTASGQGAFKTALSKMSGERGVLTDRDIRRVSADPSVMASIRRSWDLAISGQLPESDIEEYNTLIKILQKKAAAEYQEAIENFATTGASAFKVDPARALQLLTPVGGYASAESLAPEKSEAQKSREAWQAKRNKNKPAAPGPAPSPSPGVPNGK